MSDTGQAGTDARPEPISGGQRGAVLRLYAMMSFFACLGFAGIFLP